VANNLQNACDEQSYGNRADEDIPKRGNCEQEDQRGSDGEEQPWKIPAHGQPVHRNAAMWKFDIHISLDALRPLGDRPALSWS